MAHLTKAGSYHIRFPDAVTEWLDMKRRTMGYNFVQDVVRHLVQDAYLREQAGRQAVKALSGNTRAARKAA